MSSKINLQTCEYACKSSIFQDNQLIYHKHIQIFLIMWRGYRYSTAIVAGTHCAFLTMRGYNEYEIYTVLPGMCYNYCSRIVY